MAKIFSIVAAVTVFCAATPAQAAQVLTRKDYVPMKGTVLLADIQSNTGYLIYPAVPGKPARYLPFLLASGRQEHVSYLGMRYFARTPIGEWLALETKKQAGPDFGETGFFIRLYKNGTVRTSYGLHSTKYVDEWMKEANRYKSFGCLIFDEDLLQNFIKPTHQVNDGSLRVITTDGQERLIEELKAREMALASL